MLPKLGTLCPGTLCPGTFWPGFLFHISHKAFERLVRTSMPINKLFVKAMKKKTFWPIELHLMYYAIVSISNSPSKIAVFSRCSQKGGFNCNICIGIYGPLLKLNKNQVSINRSVKCTSKIRVFISIYPSVKCASKIRWLFPICRRVWPGNRLNPSCMV